MNKIKLPPVPSVVEFVAHHLWMQDAAENKRTQADLTNHVKAWGRACAEAALEAAAKLLDGMEEEDGDCGICALEASDAIRNIKIED